MDKDKKQMPERILNLTLEIIYLLTGEDYIVVKNISEEDEGWSRDQDPITVSPPHLLTHEVNDYQKILKLTNNITELLTGEIPIRCRDVTVYFSMEEWEYLERHKDQYEDIIIENHQTLISPDEFSKVTTPERCSSPLYSKDYPEKNQNVPQEHQVTNLSNIKAEDITEEEIYVGVTHLCKEEESPTDISPDGGTKNLAANLLLSPDYEVKYNITEDNQRKHFTTFLTTNIPSVLHSSNLSSYPSIHQESLSGQSQIVTQSTGEREDNTFPFSEYEKCFTKKSNQRTHSEEKSFSCPECQKCFSQKSELLKHQVIHGEKPFSCSQYGKCFTKKSYFIEHCVTDTEEEAFSCSECGKHFTMKSSLVSHQKWHTGERSFSCSECGKRFQRKSFLIEHQRTHTGEKPFSCPECEKCFTRKSHLVEHCKRHAVEKPYSCPECGKCFSHKSNVVKHQVIHKEEKPFSCTQCGKCFIKKSNLVTHQKCHTGEKPFSCSECGKCFIQKSNLVTHQKCHTGEKPFSCSVCGKCFTRKASVIEHQRIHTGEKPFPCSECGKCFRQKSDAVNHQVIHTGEKPFSCSECGKCYNHRSTLAQHKQRRHNTVQTVANLLPQV